MTLPTRNVLALVVGLLALGGLVATSMKWTAASAEETCCKEGDTTPPTELVAKFLKGQLLSPYPDYAKLAKDDPDLVKKFRLPGCNECHGGTGGGGICPALTQAFGSGAAPMTCCSDWLRLVRRKWRSRATSGSAMAACTHQCRPWA